MKPTRVCAAELILTILTFAASSVLSDSSFSVKIEDDVSVENCPKILSNLEVNHSSSLQL